MADEPRDHIVEEGECFSQLAFENGFFWQTLWDDPDNAALKEERRSPFVLSPGDKVRIIARRPGTVAAATGRVHRFRRRGVPAALRVKLLGKDNAPLADQPFSLVVDGQTLTGRTDANGLVETWVTPNAQSAQLTVGTGEESVVHQLLLRRLDPESGTRGIQARLANLGMYGGPINGTLDDATRAALRLFAAVQKLDPESTDDAIAEVLRDMHGC